MLGDAVIADETRKLTYTSLSINGIQQDTFLSFTIKQVFTNNTGQKADIIYFIPSEQQFCTYDPMFIVNGNVIKPKLRPKEEAMKEFKEAKDYGYMAMIGEYAGNGLDSFGLGNIGPNCKVEINLKITFLADINENGYIYKFPLTHKYQKGSVTNDLPENFEFTIKIMTMKEIKKLNVTAKGNMKIIDNHNAIFETKTTPRDDAIIIETSIKDEDKGIAISSDGYIAISTYPYFEGKVENNSEFYFLIDCSGSMYGSRIENAKFCLNLLIHSLPIDSRFSIIKFGTSYEEIFPICDYTNKNVKIAMRQIKDLDADMDGTDILSPLEYVYTQTTKNGYHRKIFLLTDGQVHNSDVICSLAQEKRDNNRIYAIGLGSGADPGLIKNVSLKSLGNYVLIADKDNMNEKVIELMESSISPYLTNISIQSENTVTEMWPSPCPPIYSRNPQNFFIKSPFVENILISGFVEKEEICLTIPVSKCNDNLGLKQLFNRYILDDYESKILDRVINRIPYFYLRDIRSYISERVDSVLKNECVKLSIESGVLCYFTSYIGVGYQSDIDMRINYDAYIRTHCLCSIAPEPPNLNRGCVKSGSRKQFEFDIKKDDTKQDENSKHGIISYILSWIRKAPKEISPETLISNQNVDGSWDNFDDMDPKIKSKYGNNVAATVAAVSYIQKAFKDNLTEYSLMIRKAMAFLKNIDSEVDWNEVIKNAN